MFFFNFWCPLLSKMFLVMMLSFYTIIAGIWQVSTGGQADDFFCVQQKFALNSDQA